MSSCVNILDRYLPRIAALETNVGILLESAKQDEKRIVALGERVVALERRLGAIEDALGDHDHAPFWNALAKQLAINSALDAILPYLGREVHYSSQWAELQDALREARE